MIQAGTKLGRYEIRSKIGAGGMGEVYQARDMELGRDVAVKVLPSSFSADASRLHRFQQEACAAGALNHPNVLIVHDIGACEALHTLFPNYLKVRRCATASVVRQ
jgi:eukaryotic-like serine/threonine-protein kinase